MFCTSVPPFNCFRTYLSLRHILAPFPARFRAHFLVRFRSRPFFLDLSARVRASLCSDLTLTREMNRETWSPLSIEFNV